MFVSRKIWETATSIGQDETPSALAFNSDGSRLVVSIGHRVLLYSCSDGKLIKQLKGHKDNVHSVSCSFDGRRIASGGADKSTIIWNEEAKGILKFTHSDSVQVVAYNPVEDLLVSCSSSDFGFWSPQEKSVVKHRVDSKILCASWRNDGLIIALGFYSGKISLYNVHGEEIGKIGRDAPVWSVSWNRYSSTDPVGDILAVGSWDMTLSFYDEFCQQLNEDQYLDYYPCSIAFYGNTSDYLIVGGSSGNFRLLSKEGVCLQDFSNSSDSSWIWCTKGFSEKQIIASVDSSGLVSCCSIDSDESVHHKSRQVLAYRESGTSIMVRHINQDYNKTINGNGYIRALAVLDDEVAFVVQEQIFIYHISSECRLKNLIAINLAIDFMKMTSNHLIVSIDNKVKAYNSTTGEMVREWYLDSNITCIQNLSNVIGEERVLVGCQDGKILVVSVDSPLYGTILHAKNAITSIDVSCKKRYIGFICNKSHLFIFDQITKAYVQDAEGPQSIIFHDEVEYLYCSGSDEISAIQDVHSKEFSQEVECCRGEIIQFTGFQMLSLQKDSTLRCDEVNVASLASHKIKTKNFKAAFEIALLGSADDFFRYLAKEALLHSDFSVSTKCYQHLNMPGLIEYTRTQEHKAPQDCSSPNEVKACITAEIAMLENKFSEASKSLMKAGLSQELIDFFVKMRKFKEAKDLSKDNDKSHLTIKEAEWEEQMKNWEKASSLYLECKSYVEAVDVVGKFKGHGWIEAMCELTCSIPETEVEALKKCCHHLSGEVGMDDAIKSVYVKIKDYSSLIQLYTKNRQWLEISELYQNHENDIDRTLMIPYADWLAVQGSLNEALNIYRKVERHDKSIKLILALIDHSILDYDFKETSALYRTLAREASLVMRDSENAEFEMNARDSEQLSRLFYVYGLVADNFALWDQFSPVVTFNACAYFLNSFDLAKLPRGVSVVKVLHQFAKNASSLGAYQAARNSYEKIREEFLVPPNLRNEIALESMMVLSTPKQDNPDMIPVCYRCGSANPLVDKKPTMHCSQGDSCRTCLHPFVRCFINFDILPLIEFKPNQSISPKEALALVKKYSVDESNANECFNEAINSILNSTELTGYMCVDVDEKILESFNREEVYTVRDPASGEIRFYKNMIPEIGIAVCHECCQFFHEEDYEYEFLKQDGCPFCKAKTDQYGHV